MLKIGIITKDQILKANKKAMREMEFDFHVGWMAKDRPHKNKKKYNRKSQSKLKDWDFSFVKFKNNCLK